MHPADRAPWDGRVTAARGSVPSFIAANLRPPNSPDLNAVDYNQSVVCDAGPYLSGEGVRRWRSD